jgi:predicted  nucleic acid-binding Zn-ribbon protein
MNQTLNLFRLQQIDTQLDRINTRLDAIQNSLEDDEELRQLDELARLAENRFSSAKSELNRCEQLVERQQIKIEQTQSDLYGKKQHSPKELQDLQNDVAALKRHLSTLEDAQIEAMISCEDAESELQVARDAVIAARQKRLVFDKDLIQERDSLISELERYGVERNAVATVIPTPELDMYDQLRKTHRGVAVAAISDSSCGACGSTLNRALIQSVRSSGQPLYCPSCSRILYGS